LRCPDSTPNGIDRNLRHARCRHDAHHRRRDQKGGVGKTTTSGQIGAASLSAMKRRVLVVDLDPQGNATTGSGVDKRAPKRNRLQGAAGRMQNRRRAPTRSPSVTTIWCRRIESSPAPEVELVELPERETRLKDALAEALQQMRSAIDEV